jgi:hypothetical protein
MARGQEHRDHCRCSSILSFKAPPDLLFPTRTPAGALNAEGRSLRLRQAGFSAPSTFLRPPAH